MKSDTSKFLETKLLFEYFCSNTEFDFFVIQYEKGVDFLKLIVDNNQIAILNFVLKYPKTIKIVDCGLAIFMKHSNLRKRFVLAGAISEATTDSVGFYFNQKSQKFAFLKFLWIGFSAATTIVLAFFLFKIKSWK